MKKPNNYYCHRNIELKNSDNFKHEDLEVIDKIGEGAFGTVYKVFDPQQSKLMVIKKNKDETGGCLIR